METADGTETGGVGFVGVMAATATEGLTRVENSISHRRAVAGRDDRRDEYGSSKSALNSFLHGGPRRQEKTVVQRSRR